mmetsp:Transcript_82913/g.216409  ORF Transcript_82913/g.216409 Transcript_82913/m.216409 type:complete len:291 (-) Transcript_82913:397-1269(-)
MSLDRLVSEGARHAETRVGGAFHKDSVVDPAVWVSLRSHLASTAFDARPLVHRVGLVINCLEQKLSVNLRTYYTPRVAHVGRPQLVSFPEAGDRGRATSLDVPPVLQRMPNEVGLSCLECLDQCSWDVAWEERALGQVEGHGLAASVGDYMAEGAMPIEHCSQSVAVLEVGHREVVLVRPRVSEAFAAFLASDDRRERARKLLRLVQEGPLPLVHVGLAFGHGAMNMAGGAVPQGVRDLLVGGGLTYAHGAAALPRLHVLVLAHEHGQRFRRQGKVAAPGVAHVRRRSPV